MGYNSANYIHTLYQAMNLAFADRDFYYGDPYLPPEEPVAGLLSKDYAAQRRALINPERTTRTRGPATPTRSRARRTPSGAAGGLDADPAGRGRRRRRGLPAGALMSHDEASSPAPRRSRPPTPTAG
jgi:hypothetical protein